MKPAVLTLAFLLLGPAAPPVSGEAECAWIYAGAGKPTGGPSPANAELCRKGFLLSFNPRTGVADWVMERLSHQRLYGNANRDRSRFRPDPQLQVSPVPADYRGSGYDRGHLAPAADMKWSQQAMDESFCLSNIAPQTGTGFNRGIWARLEGKIRSWTANKGQLVVITGPIYYDYQPTIGFAVVVPDEFFKIVYAPGADEALAFLIPNRDHGNPALEGFRVAIDQIEELSGYDFLTGLAAEHQDRLEADIQAIWP